MKEVRNKPTTEEKEAAMDLQRPIQGEDKPVTAVQRSNTFAQLAKFSRNSNLMFGGNAQWIQPVNLFNKDYQDGLESVPFYITNAFRYVSKHGYGERLGLEIALSNGRMYQVALGLNENDSVRMKILGTFQSGDTTPVGPFQLVKLPTRKGNDYYDLRPLEIAVRTNDAIDVPFTEINDKDIPF
jgi:hypothetical protein